MEMAVTQPDGSKTWEAFNSERLPWLLEDALKRNTVRRSFEIAARRLEPKEVFQMLPTRFPMTHIAVGTHPVTRKPMTFSGVAKYPLSEWERSGAPVMTQKGWGELLMRICQYDMSDLRPLHDVAKFSLASPNACKMPAWMTRER